MLPASRIAKARDVTVFSAPEFVALAVVVMERRLLALAVGRAQRLLLASLLVHICNIDRAEWTRAVVLLAVSAAPSAFTMALLVPIP